MAFGEPCHPWRHDQPGGETGEGDLLMEFGVVDHDSAAQGGVVPVEELRRRVDDDVRPQLERPLVVGGQEGVVRDVEDAPVTGEGRHRSQIGHFQRRVGG
jgi:hypothetical protein